MHIKDPLEVAFELKEFLQGKIYGQDNAIEAVVDSVKNKVLDESNRPKQIYFFLGPPATGKTYFAQNIMEYFSDYKFLEVNMGEYQSLSSKITLFGTERGYKSEQNGLLTNFVHTNPKTIVLIDEFEKAHTSIQKSFLTMLSAGYLNDALGWVQILAEEYEPFDSENDRHKSKDAITKVDFTQTIVIFTSNLGSALYNNHEFLEQLDDEYQSAEALLLQEIAQEQKIEDGNSINAIVPEMLSRLSQGQIVLFNKLQMYPLRKIAADIFNQKIKQLALNYQLQIEYKTNPLYFLQVQLLRFTPEIDVRRLKAKIYEIFTDNITDFLLSENKRWKDIELIEIKVGDEAISYMKEHISLKMKEKTLLKELFRKNITLKVQESVQLEGKRLTYTIESIVFEKMLKPSDTLGIGKIQFDVPATTFEDIDGHTFIKERLKEIATFLKEPELLKKFDAKVPKGMLLYGKPGTGKTMLARAFANYSDLPFIATTANELINFGTSDYSSMKEVFQRAREYAPSIVFIDEIDTFGRRGSNISPASINELLTQIDGFSQNVDENIFIIAATNYKDNIDEAILRSGRIELHLEVPPLDRKGRESFIKRMLQKPSQNGIDIQKLVSYTTGMSGADLQKVANEVALYAIRNQHHEITEESLIEQINIQKYGHRMVTKSLEDELEEIAYHEAGHAVLSLVLFPNVKIEQVTIIPRENATGFVALDGEYTNDILSKKELEAQVCIFLAGRVSQIYKFGEDAQDIGALSDLNKATQIVYTMIKDYGMDSEYGNTSFEEVSQTLQVEIEKKVIKHLQTLTKQTQLLVEKHFEVIEKVAKVLLEKEILFGDEVSRYINKEIK